MNSTRLATVRLGGVVGGSANLLGRSPPGARGFVVPCRRSEEQKPRSETPHFYGEFKILQHSTPRRPSEGAGGHRPERPCCTQAVCTPTRPPLAQRPSGVRQIRLEHPPCDPRLALHAPPTAPDPPPTADGGLGTWMASALAAVSLLVPDLPAPPACCTARGPSRQSARARGGHMQERYAADWR